MKDYIQRLLNLAKITIDKIAGGEEVVKNGTAFGDAENDIEIAADKVLGELLLAKLYESGMANSIAVEGIGLIEVGDNSCYHWFVDPLDGSLNYKMRGRTLGLPYTTCVTVFKKTSLDLKFIDVIAAGIIDLRSGDLWSAKKSGESRIVTTLNDYAVHVLKASNLNLGSMIVIGEMYYPENRERLVRAFAGMKGWLRNPGSAAYEMALVASGQAAAFICDRQKMHELGAGYALVKGAGGVVVDFNGNDLAERRYDFNSQTDVILAANQNIADEIVNLLKK